MRLEHVTFYLDIETHFLSLTQLYDLQSHVPSLYCRIHKIRKQFNSGSFFQYLKHYITIFVRAALKIELAVKSSCFPSPCMENDLIDSPFFVKYSTCRYRQLTKICMYGVTAMYRFITTELNFNSQFCVSYVSYFNCSPVILSSFIVVENESHDRSRDRFSFVCVQRK